MSLFRFLRDQEKDRDIGRILRPLSDRESIGIEINIASWNRDTSEVSRGGSSLDDLANVSLLIPWEFLHIYGQ